MGYPQNPQIINLSLNGSEQPVTMPTYGQDFSVKSRTGKTILVSYVAGGTSSGYLTIDPGYAYYEENVLIPKTVYFKGTAGDTAEIVVWGGA